MTLPVYPSYDPDESVRLLQRLGTFWTTTFGQQGLLQQLLTGRDIQYRQTSDDYIQATETPARLQCPAFQSKTWKKILLQTDNLSVYGDRPLRYQEAGARYGVPGDQPPYDRTFNYGESLTGNNYAFPLDPTLKHITLLCNRIDRPTVVLVRGVDFEIDEDNDLLILYFDPFANDQIYQWEVYRTGEETGKEAVLWAFKSRIDRDYLWKHWGYALPFRLTSGDLYRDTLNAIYDQHVAGSHTGGLDALFSAALGVPLCQSDGEIVEQILEGRKLHIVTDKAAYEYTAGSVPVVAVGDTVNAGDRLVDTFSVEYLQGKNIGPGAAGLQRTTINQTDVVIRNTDWTPTAAVVPIRTYRTDPPIRDFQGRATGANKYYGNETVTLTKRQLPEHEFLEIKFSVLVVGDGWSGTAGNTRFVFKLDGATLVDEYFSNGASTQTYPEAESPAKSGSIHRVLSFHNYAVYQFEFLVPHTAREFTATWTVSGLQQARVDGWSIYSIDDAPVGLQYLGPAFGWGQLYIPIERYKGFFYDLSTLSGFGHKLELPELTQFLANWYAAKEVFIGDGRCRITPYGLVPSVDGSLVPGPGLLVCGQNLRTAQQSANDLAVNTAVALIEGSGKYAIYTNAGWLLSGVEVNLRSRTVDDLQTRTPYVLETFSRLAGITLGNGYLAGNYFSGINFPNREVPVEYSIDASGRAEVRFEVRGFPGDVDTFWEGVRSRGLAQGFTLANLMDTRENPSGDPTPADVPATINPMIFALRHFLQYNTFLVDVRAGLEAEGAPLNDAIRQARLTLPPHVNFFLLTELVVPGEVLDFVWTEEVTIGAGPDVEESWGAAELTGEDPFVSGVEGVIA